MTAGLHLTEESDVSAHDAARLETCLRQLRLVLGEETTASRQKLVQVALAADFDLNRALNFYYSS